MRGGVFNQCSLGCGIDIVVYPWYAYHFVSVIPKKAVVQGRVEGGGGSHHKFMNTNFAFHESRNKIVYLNSATCLGDLCLAINSLLKCEVTSKTQK